MSVPEHLQSIIDALPESLLLELFVSKIIIEHPEAVDNYFRGDGLSGMNTLMRAGMQAFRGKINPAYVAQEIKKQLKEIENDESN